MKTAVPLLLLLAASASAETSVVLHGLSHHLSGREFNGQNWGAGVRYSVRDFGIQAGVYRNSYDRTSTYALVDWQPLTAGPVSAGVFLGTVNNYPLCNGRFVPAGGAVATLDLGRVRPRVRYVPAFRDCNNATLSLELDICL